MEVREFVGSLNEGFDQCFRCGACSGVCPVKRLEKRFDPRLIVHLLLNGFYERVLTDLL